MERAPSAGKRGGDRPGLAVEEGIGRILQQRGWTLAVAESCSGGLLAHRITGVPGASAYFERGFVTYSNKAKEELLGVPPILILAHGAVSAPVARAMAQGACRAADAACSVSITGIAGPSGGSPAKPVGTVYLACCRPGHVRVERHLFTGGRRAIQRQSVEAALRLLHSELKR